MRRIQEIEREKVAMTSIVQLTGAFEGIASAHIARIKTQVQQSELFFRDLWKVYTGLRVDSKFHSGHSEKGPEINKDLIIIITAEGSLSGDIDKRLIEQLLSAYDRHDQDIIVIGHHGTVLLEQRKIAIAKSFRLPEQDDEAADVKLIVNEVRRYKSTTVFYQAYLSLMKQEIKQIGLSAVVEERGENVEIAPTESNIITDRNFIFEPTVPAVIDHMEQSMLAVALSEVIMESRLAQQASRFRAMSAARIRARDSEEELILQFNHAGRAIKDERTREIISSLQKGTV